ncbi:MAG: hypothetical protein MZU79_02485 [Anaerotruncus sp.]|nr:hypothetical protein [Anaerotruncus sp.]
MIKILLTECASNGTDHRPGQLRPHRLLHGQAGRPGRLEEEDQLPDGPALRARSARPCGSPSTGPGTSASRRAPWEKPSWSISARHGVFLKTLSSFPEGLGHSAEDLASRRSSIHGQRPDRPREDADQGGVGIEFEVARTTSNRLSLLQSHVRPRRPSGT